MLDQLILGFPDNPLFYVSEILWTFQKNSYGQSISFLLFFIFSPEIKEKKTV